MNDPIYYLEIEEGDGLTQVSLVNSPAIELDFHYFSAEQFVTPTAGESEEEFIGRCVPILIGEGKEQEQAVAICYSYWEDKTAMASFSDYPEAAKANAERGIRLNEEGGNKCATQVGKVRAQQIAGGEPLSEETIKRTYSFLSRAQEYYNPEDDAACGTISYLLWGGEEMLRWCESKLNEIERESMAFAIQSEERRIITGPAMIAEKPILRRAEDGSTYYVKFSAETIAKAVKLWALQNKYNAVNAEHANPVGGMHLLESFIVDKQRGINPPQAWADAPEGSWFLSYYVEDDAVWADIKAGKFRGFSIEGYFTDKPADPAEETLAAMRAILAKCDTLNINTLSEMNALNKIQEIKKLLGFSDEAPVQKFGEGTLADGTLIRWAGETLEIGAVLEVQTPEGEYVPAPDGTHETADGQLVSTEGGIVTEIMLKENGQEPAAMKNDGSKDDVVAAFAKLEKFQVDENMKIVLKALMEYCFGWELREAEQKQIREAAINSYKQGFSAIEQKIENLTNAQAKTVEVLEQFSAIPAEEPVKKPNAFSGMAAKRDEQIMRVAENLKKLKNNK